MNYSKKEAADLDEDARNYNPRKKRDRLTTQFSYEENDENILQIRRSWEGVGTINNSYELSDEDNKSLLNLQRLSVEHRRTPFPDFQFELLDNEAESDGSGCELNLATGTRKKVSRGDSFEDNWLFQKRNPTSRPTETVDFSLALSKNCDSAEELSDTEVDDLARDRPDELESSDEEKWNNIRRVQRPCVQTSSSSASDESESISSDSSSDNNESPENEPDDEIPILEENHSIRGSPDAAKAKAQTPVDNEISDSEDEECISDKCDEKDINDSEDEECTSDKCDEQDINDSEDEECTSEKCDEKDINDSEDEECTSEKCDEKDESDSSSSSTKRRKKLEEFHRKLFKLPEVNVTSDDSLKNEVLKNKGGKACRSRPVNPLLPISLARKAPSSSGTRSCESEDSSGEEFERKAAAFNQRRRASWCPLEKSQPPKRKIKRPMQQPRLEEEEEELEDPPSADCEEALVGLERHMLHRDTYHSSFHAKKSSPNFVVNPLFMPDAGAAQNPRRRPIEEHDERYQLHPQRYESGYSSGSLDSGRNRSNQSPVRNVERRASVAGRLNNRSPGDRRLNPSNESLSNSDSSFLW